MRHLFTDIVQVKSDIWDTTTNLHRDFTDGFAKPP